MPVIRGRPRGKSLPEDQRKILKEKLETELAGQPPTEPAEIKRPLIFEIPLERLDGTSDRIDVLVVWDSFQEIRSEDRTMLIMDAYHERAEKIVQALGVTREEALEQALLPYDVKAFSRIDNVDKVELQKAMLDEGGIEFGGGKVVLRLPTEAMAMEAALRVMERVPQVQTCVERVI